MLNALVHLNYLAVLGTAIAGFLLGWLWYSPVLFAKAWMTEMKITEEKMKACAEKGMAFYFVKGFLYTLVSTAALAVLLTVYGTTNPLKGAIFGAFAGLALVGARMLNGSVWEERSLKLMAILVGHETVLFALQGAILAVWR
jgi:hypothetical protein